MMTIVYYEVGPGFLTVWGYTLDGVKKTGINLFPLLPNYLQACNPPNLDRHDPSTFHLAGIPEHPDPDSPYRVLRHFHIEFPDKDHTPTSREIMLIDSLLVNTLKCDNKKVRYFWGPGEKP